MAEAHATREHSQSPPTYGLSIEPGMRVSVPASIAEGTLDYFIPSRLARIANSDVAVECGETVPAPGPRQLLGMWLLMGARYSTIGSSVGEQSEVQRLERVGQRLARPTLCVQDLLDAQGIMAATPDGGRFRDAIAWVEGHTPGRARYLPPPTSAVAPLMEDLLRFLRRDDVALWIRQALAYYQMVHIHPFADGNGRFSRALVAALHSVEAANRAVGLLVAAGIAINKHAITCCQESVRSGSLDSYLGKWRTLQSWAQSTADDLCQTEQLLRIELTAASGSASVGSTLWPLLANRLRVGTAELAATARWSARNELTYLHRLTESGWLTRANDDGRAWISPRLQAVRENVLVRVQQQTAGFFG